MAGLSRRPAITVWQKGCFSLWKAVFLLVMIQAGGKKILLAGESFCHASNMRTDFVSDYNILYLMVNFNKSKRVLIIGLKEDPDL